MDSKTIQERIANLNKQWDQTVSLFEKVEKQKSVIEGRLEEANHLYNTLVKEEKETQAKLDKEKEDKKKARLKKKSKPKKSKPKTVKDESLPVEDSGLELAPIGSAGQQAA